MSQHASDALRAAPLFRGWPVRLCNAYASASALVAFHNESGVRTLDTPDPPSRTLTAELPYKHCVDVKEVRLARGSRLDFRLERMMDVRVGVFEVHELPSNGSLLHITVFRDGCARGLARFASHVFGESYNPQFVLIDASGFCGGSKAFVELRTSVDQEVLRFGMEAIVPPGIYEWRLKHPGLHATASSDEHAVQHEAIAWQRYAVMRVGADAMAGSEYAEELLILPTHVLPPALIAPYIECKTHAGTKWMDAYACFHWSCGGRVNAERGPRVDLFHELDLDCDFVLAEHELENLVMTAAAVRDLGDCVDEWRTSWIGAWRRWRAVPFVHFVNAAIGTSSEKIQALRAGLRGVADAAARAAYMSPRASPWQGLAGREGLWGRADGPHPACWDLKRSHEECCLREKPSCWDGLFSWELCCVVERPPLVPRASQGALAYPADLRRPPLLEIMQRHGSDKAVNGYCSMYDALLRDVDVRRLLEVGIGSTLLSVSSSMAHMAAYRPGASLRAWREYFPRAEIYGMDVAPDTRVREARVRTALADSTEQVHVESVMASWGITADGHAALDLVVDDGLHTPEAQLATLANIFPYLAKGGLYVIEDIVMGKHMFRRANRALSRIVGASPRSLVEGFRDETVAGGARHDGAVLVVRKA